MQCHSFGGRSSIRRRVHLLLCAECRGAKAVDATVRRGIERLVAEPAPSDGLARALAALPGKPTLRRARSRRWLSALSLRFMPVGSTILAAAVGSAGWIGFIDRPPVMRIPAAAMPADNARNILARAIAAIPAQDLASMDGSRADRVQAAITAGRIAPASHELPPRNGNGKGGAPARPPAPELPFDTLYGRYVRPAQRAALAREYRPALDLARRSFGHPYRAPLPASFDHAAQELPAYRRLAEALELEARVSAERGDYGSAAASALDAVELGALIPQGSGINAKLTGLACQKDGRAALWPIVCKLSAAQAEAAAARLGRIMRAQTPMAVTLENEKEAYNLCLRTMFADRGWRAHFARKAYGTDLFVQTGCYALLLPYSKQRIIDEFGLMFDREIARARQPYEPHREMYYYDPLETRDPVVAAYYPAMGWRFAEVYGAETQNTLLMTALALRAYEQVHGSPPDRLDRLVPTLLPVAPMDPFAPGRPLGYRIVARAAGRHAAAATPGVVLYSVGPDRKDDGGAPAGTVAARSGVPTRPPDRTSFLVQPGTEGDVVAGINTDK